jgi:hypothetical protein
VSDAESQALHFTGSLWLSTLELRRALALAPAGDRQLVARLSVLVAELASLTEAHRPLRMHFPPPIPTPETVK